MTSTFPALQRYPFVETRSLEEAAALHASINAPLRTEWLDRRVPFSWQANRIVVGGLSLAISSYRAAVRASTPNVDKYSLVISLRGGARVVNGDKNADV